jgi:hypothetical protein
MIKYNNIIVQNFQKKFPELNGIDRSINKYARALMTEIPTIKKIWNGFAHLHYKPDMYTNKYIRCTNSLLEGAIERQQIPDDWRHCFHIIEFNTSGNYAKIYPNTQDRFYREDNTVFIRMSKNWNEYYISRDKMETWETKTVRKFNMVKHANGETSELECLVNVNLVGLMINHNKHNIELKRKGGKQGLKVKMIFNNTYETQEDIKDNILDAYKICAARYGFAKGYKTFYRMMKALGNGEYLSLSATDGKSSLICCLLDDVHNYKSIYRINNKDITENTNLNLNTNLPIYSYGHSSKNKLKKIKPEIEAASLKEVYPENYQVCYPPRKDGINGKKYKKIVKSLFEPQVQEATASPKEILDFYYEMTKDSPFYRGENFETWLDCIQKGTGNPSKLYIAKINYLKEKGA